MDKTDDQIHEALIAILKEASGGLLVIRSDDGPQPNGEYISILEIDQDETGLPAFLQRSANFGFDGDGLPFDQGALVDEVPTHIYLRQSAETVTTFSVQVYRGNPSEVCRRIRNYINAPWGQELVQNQGVNISAISSPLQTNYKVAEKQVLRSSMQIIVESSSDYEKLIPIIGEVEITVNGQENLTVN